MARRAAVEERLQHLERAAPRRGDWGGTSNVIQEPDADRSRFTLCRSRVNRAVIGALVAARAPSPGRGARRGPPPQARGERVDDDSSPVMRTQKLHNSPED